LAGDSSLEGGDKTDGPPERPYRLLTHEQQEGNLLPEDPEDASEKKKMSGGGVELSSRLSVRTPKMVKKTVLATEQSGSESSIIVDRKREKKRNWGNGKNPERVRATVRGPNMPTSDAGTRVQISTMRKSLSVTSGEKERDEAAKKGTSSHKFPPNSVA